MSTKTKVRKTANIKRRKRRSPEEMIADLEARIEELRAQQDGFRPDWVSEHREKVRLSAADYGALVGVSGLTVYNWEKGKSRPRKAQLAKWQRVRHLGRREAWQALDEAGV